ncbi:DUF4407 domain-containing protein [Gaetbulibacter aestuarii]|uniref:DUF4407 domain-containing protein n=1 Tax=Gaetbulibacter aestuarii TaxID=1502358 RepID=A0ABW7MW69_9FLAO
MLKSFFILCSGADSKILDDCSPGEQNKYVGIGASVFLTALMAFIAAAYALNTVFDNIWIAVFFGIVWGMLIFNLDRFIVSTIKKTGSFKSEFIQATPRIILAIIIAVVISKPLELKIFEKEINQVLLEEKNDMTLANQNQILEQYTPEITAMEKEIADLQNAVKTKETEVNNLYDIYIGEAEGRTGTKLLGKGPVYKEKREKHDAALAELQTLKETNAKKISDLETKIDQLKSDYDTQVGETQPVIDNFDGLMARIRALGKLPWLPSFFIFLLFLAVETAPIMAKLLAPKGAYDFKLDDEELAIKTHITQNKTAREGMLQTDTVMNQRLYTELESDAELYDHKRKKAKDILKLQADAFYEKQKSVL